MPGPGSIAVDSVTHSWLSWGQPGRETDCRAGSWRPSGCLLHLALLAPVSAAASSSQPRTLAGVYPSKWGRTTKADHPREKGGWDPGTLNRVEFVSSLQHHHPATGRGENLRTEGEAATQEAAVGSGSSCWEQRLRILPASPPSAPPSAHGASD